MKFTNEQKVLALLLTDIHQHLGIQDGMDAKLVAEAIYSDNEWALDWKYGGRLYSSDEEMPPHVKHVVAVLDMWRFIEDDFEALEEPEKQRFLNEAKPYGRPSFPGFDGNNESDYMSAARMLVETMGDFEHFAGRGGLNSHSPTVATSRRMLEVFLPIRATIGLGEKRRLSADDLIAIYKARVHPDNR